MTAASPDPVFMRAAVDTLFSELRSRVLKELNHVEIRKSVTGCSARTYLTIAEIASRIGAPSSVNMVKSMLQSLQKEGLVESIRVPNVADELWRVKPEGASGEEASCTVD